MVSALEQIDDLRKDARRLKQRITQLTFVGVAISAIMFGVVVGYFPEDPRASVAVATVVILLLFVAQTNISLQERANCRIAYELYLLWTNELPDDPPDGWQRYMRTIPWEDALRAWYIVYRVVLSQFYYPALRQTTYSRVKHWLSVFGLPRYSRLDEWKLHNNWLQSNEKIEAKSTYGSSYIRNMISILHLMAVGSTILLIIEAFRFSTNSPDSYLSSMIVQIALIVQIAFLTVLVGQRIRRDRFSLRVLEEGFLSVPACAVFWQAVIVAHFRAVQATSVGLSDYKKMLLVEAQDLSRHLNQVSQWVMAQKTTRRGDEAIMLRLIFKNDDKISIKSLSGLLTDLALLYEQTVLLTLPDYKEYRFSSQHEPREVGYIREEHQMLVHRIRYESPLEITLILTAAGASPAFLWTLLQFIEKIRNWKLNRDILEMQFKKLLLDNEVKLLERDRMLLENQKKNLENQSLQATITIRKRLEEIMKSIERCPMYATDAELFLSEGGQQVHKRNENAS